jgi:hypothetical protein
MYKIFALFAVAGLMAFSVNTVDAAEPHHSRSHSSRGHISFGNPYGFHIDLHQHRNGSLGLHLNQGHQYQRHNSYRYYNPYQRNSSRYYYNPYQRNSSRYYYNPYQRNNSRYYNPHHRYHNHR